MGSQYATKEEIQQAAELLRAGKLVAFPTETVYGLGADATNETAVRDIFEAKGRPSTNPLIVHVASRDALLQCIDLSQSANAEQVRHMLRLLGPLWPGPLSVVAPKASHISSIVSAGGDTVALRIPKHPVALELLSLCGRPIAAPSANPSMYISPTTAEHVRESLGNKVAAILNGGPCEVGLESTVLSLLGEQPTILRPGAITRDILENILGCQVATSQSAQTADSSPLLSPGMLAKHYSPYTPVILLNSLSPYPSTPQRTGAVLFANHTQLSFSPFVTKVISETGDPAEIAARLFAALRELDSMNLELIVVDTCEPVGLGAAIMDRLVRAAHPKS